MRKLILILASSVLMLALVACTRSVAADELKSNLQRETPAVASSDLQKLVEGNSTFALNLYRLLGQKAGNLFYSPYSISEALAMTYGGARGTTEEQMAKALVFLLTQEKLHPAFNALDQELAKRGEGAKGKDSKGFRLNVVNAIWGQKDFPFLSSYLDLLAKNYGAGLRIVDFIKAPEESRQIINQWVSEKTEEKIKDLLPKGSIDETTRLVLTNAIYFNAAWLCPFKKEATANDVFKTLEGNTVTMPFMNQQESFNYARGTDYQAIELPYDGRELSMVIIL
ncbi:MAG: serpin family protein, partial [Dehalococcoidales bacterium]|nr:serpin family protein [Dehalococcoidales bacterium]